MRRLMLRLYRHRDILDRSRQNRTVSKHIALNVQVVAAPAQQSTMACSTKIGFSRLNWMERGQGGIPMEARTKGFTGKGGFAN